MARRSETYEDFPHVAAGLKYARDVVAGKIPAGKYARLACERQLSDLRKAGTKSFPYTFDPAKAEKFCKFLELMVHTKGKWAARKERIKLEPWQQFGFTTMMGWVRPNETRRFRSAYWSVGRKNGKSIIAAGTGNYFLTEDGEFGAEVYCGATSEKQAWEVFRPARLMAQRNAEYREWYGIEVNAKNLNIAEDDSRFEPVIGDPGDGSSPHLAIVDEYHEHKTSAMVDTMVTGMGAREQPMLFVITTAGFDIYGPCYEMQEDMQSILDGVYQDEEKFALIYSVDAEDDWTDPGVLIKANPNLGVSVSRDYLESQQREAVRSPSKQARFKTKGLNVWVSAKESYFNVETWLKLGDPKLAIDRFAGQRAYMGIDLASKRDFTSRATVFPVVENGLTHYFVFPTLYLPEARIEEDKTGRFRRWRDEGWIVQTEGEELDFWLVTRDILADAKRFELVEVPFDPNMATQMGQAVREEGVNAIDYTQSAKNMGAPMDEFNAAIEAGRVHHQGNPAFGWMMSNVINRDPTHKLPFPGKDRPEKKIDGPVSTIMAIGRIMANEQDESIVDYQGLAVA